MKRAIKTFVKTKVLRSLFRLGQLCGFDLLPRHFYSEIPDLRHLSSSESWRVPYQPPIDNWADLTAQYKFTRGVLGQCHENVDRLREHLCNRAGEQGFGSVESAALVSFVITQKPLHILQIGCGASTALILHAAKTVGYRPHLLCVEPYPSAFLRDCESSGQLELWRQPAQDLLSNINDAVEALPVGSLFFVDSSHTLGPAGECTRLICEALPRLKAGCYAHFHDIKFPYDYPRHILSNELFFPHESALLMAFLCCNPRFQIAASLSMLHYEMPDRLAEIFCGYTPERNEDGLSVSPGHFPSSCYLLCVGDP